MMYALRRTKTLVPTNEAREVEKMIDLPEEILLAEHHVLMEAPTTNEQHNLAKGEELLSLPPIDETEMTITNEELNNVIGSTLEPCCTDAYMI